MYNHVPVHARLHTWTEEAFGDVDLEVWNDLRAGVDEIEQVGRMIEVSDAVILDVDGAMNLVDTHHRHRTQHHRDVT